MTKESDKNSVTDSELGSVRSGRGSKLGAILCPTICAIILVCTFAVLFIGIKLAYDQYAYSYGFCNTRRFDITKLNLLPNITSKLLPN